MINPSSCIAPLRSLAARRRTTKLLTFDDDQEEKENSLNDTFSARRQSRLFNTSLIADPAHDEPAQTPTQLVDLYQKTVELATQGKINVKNAFSIPLVERLPQVLNAIALEDIENHHLGPNFVKAGAVIDTRWEGCQIEEEYDVWRVPTEWPENRVSTKKATRSI